MRKLIFAAAMVCLATIPAQTQTCADGSHSFAEYVADITAIEGAEHIEFRGDALSAFMSGTMEVIGVPTLPFDLVMVSHYKGRAMMIAFYLGCEVAATPVFPLELIRPYLGDA